MGCEKDSFVDEFMREFSLGIAKGFCEILKLISHKLKPSKTMLDKIGPIFSAPSSVNISEKRGSISPYVMYRIFFSR